MSSSDREISYTHQVNSRAMRMTIKVTGNGEVIVTTPRFIPKFAVHRFVESARSWIEAQQTKQAQKPKLLTHAYVYYFGKKYSLRKSNKTDGSVRVMQDMIVVAPLTNNPNAAIKLLEKWLDARAREYIAKRTHELSEVMKLPFAGMAFRTQKTRWGSCSSTKHLHFNLKLIHAPTKVIDYVIIHELAHTKHMNHGRQFWDLVAKYDPDYPHHKRWLERYGSSQD